MLTLAQQTPNAIDNLFETITKCFTRADTLAHPAAVVEALTTLSVVWAVVFIVAGALCLFNGYKFHKSATVALALVIGLFAGYWMSLRLNIQAPYLIAGCVGILLAVVAFPLMKYTVALLGGLSGAFVGANLWSSIAAVSGNADAVQHHWIGALVGLVICGMLAFVVFKLSVVFTTSVSGSLLAVFGVVALLLNFPSDALRGSISSSLTSHAIILPMLVLVPAVIGLIMQEKPAAAGATPAAAAKPVAK
jgi:hypothetical protein